MGEWIIWTVWLAIEWFALPFEWMSKTYNVKWTGKPFKQIKILLICTIGCIIGLPIIWMNKLLTGTLGNVAVYCSHLICRCCQFQGLYSHNQKWRFSISHQKNVIKNMLSKKINALLIDHKLWATLYLISLTEITEIWMPYKWGK